MARTGRSGGTRPTVGWWRSFCRSPAMTVMAAAAEAEFELVVVGFFVVLYLVIKDLTSRPDYAGIYQSRPLGADVRQ